MSIYQIAPVTPPISLRRSFIEISLSLILVYICLIYVFPSQWNLLNLNPSPFFLLVLLYSLRYRLSINFLSVSMILGFYGYIKYLNGDYLDIDDLLSWNNLYVPISALGLGSLIAWLREEQTRANIIFNHQSMTWQKELAHLRQALESRDETLNELASRIAERGESWASLQDFGRNLNSNQTDVLIRALIHQCSTLLGGQKIAWYQEQDQQLRSVYTHNQTEEIPSHLALDSGIAGLAYQRSQLITVADSQLQIQDHEAHLALGLLNQNGDKAGVLVAFDVSFPRLHKENLRHLRIASQWCMEALDRAKSWQNLMAAAIWNPMLECYNLFYLEQLVLQNTANCVRYGGTFSLCSLHAHYNHGDHHVLTTIEAFLLRKFLRAGDILAKGNAQNSWWIFLPSTSQSGSEKALGKILEGLNSFYESSEIDAIWKWKCVEWNGENDPQQLWQKCEFLDE